MTRGFPCTRTGPGALRSLHLGLSCKVSYQAPILSTWPTSSFLPQDPPNKVPTTDYPLPNPTGAPGFPWEKLSALGTPARGPTSGLSPGCTRPSTLGRLQWDC